MVQFLTLCTVERRNQNVRISALLPWVRLQYNRTSEIGTILLGFQTFGSLNLVRSVGSLQFLALG